MTPTPHPQPSVDTATTLDILRRVVDCLSPDAELMRREDRFALFRDASAALERLRSAVVDPACFGAEEFRSLLAQVQHYGIAPADALRDVLASRSAAVPPDEATALAALDRLAHWDLGTHADAQLVRAYLTSRAAAAVPTPGDGGEEDAKRARCEARRALYEATEQAFVNGILPPEFGPILRAYRETHHA